MPSEQMEIDPLDLIKTQDSKTATRASSKNETPIETNKRNNTQVGTCAMYLNINSLPNFKKQKYLKASINAPMQSYLCLSIDQQKDKNTNLSTNRN